MRFELAAQCAQAKTSPRSPGVRMMWRVGANGDGNALGPAAVRQGQRQFGLRCRDAPGHAQHPVAHRVRINFKVARARSGHLLDQRFLKQQRLGGGAGRGAVHLDQLPARALSQDGQAGGVRRRGRGQREQLLMPGQHGKARTAIIGQPVGKQQVLVHIGLRLPVVQGAGAVVCGCRKGLAQGVPVAAFDLEYLLRFGPVAQAREAHFDIRQRCKVTVQFSQFGAQRPVRARARAVPQQANDAWRRTWRADRFDRHLGHEPGRIAHPLPVHARLVVGRRQHLDAFGGKTLSPRACHPGLETLTVRREREDAGRWRAGVVDLYLDIDVAGVAIGLRQAIDPVGATPLQYFGVLDFDRPRAAPGDRVDAQLEVVPLCDLEQSRINLAALDFFEYLASARLVDRDGRAHGAIDVERKGGDLLAVGERELHIAFKLAAVWIEEDHPDGGLGHAAADRGVDGHLLQLDGFGAGSG